MTVTVLSDKDVYPSDEVIFRIIGDKRPVWEKIMDYTVKNYPASVPEWRYYNDGKQWLFKLQLKKKTIFWIGLVSGTFRITFYLGGNAESLISGSTLSEGIRKEFLSKDQSGHFHPVTITIRDESDLDDIFKLIDLKTRQK
jgi:hypothetical protein